MYNYVTGNFENTKVVEGDNVTVTSESVKDEETGITTTTYTVNATAEGEVKEGDTQIVSGDTVYNITGDTNYTSNNYVTNNTNLTSAISDLDNAIAQGWVAQVEGKELKTVRYDKDDETANVLNFKAGDNIEVTGSGSDVTIATAADVKFENVEVTNEFKAGDTIINEGGITTNEFKSGDTIINEGGITTNEFKSGDTVINEGGITTNNITTENIDATTIETKNINVTENITYKGDHIVTNVTYDGDTNTLVVNKGDETNNYVLKDTTYEGDNKTIQISENNVISVIEGNVAEGDTGVVTGDTVYNITGDTNYTSNNYVTNNTDLTSAISDLDNAIAQGWVAQVEGKELKTVRYDKDDETANVLNFKAGDNIEVTGSGSDVTIATAADVKFENVEVTNEFKAGDTIINEGGITTNNVTTNEFKAGDTVINEGGITTNNITTENIDATTIETENINVTENITYKGDHIVTNVTYDGDTNTLVVNKGDETNNYVLKDTTYEGDNKTIQISENNVISVIEGNVAEGDTGVVTGDTVYNETRVHQDGNYIRQEFTAAENLTALDNQIAKNAGDIISLDNRMQKGVAGAAALAALHPMDFNPDDKLQFSAGVGNYGSETAAAIGAFYRPDERVMFSIGGTFGNGNNVVNAGVTFGLDGNKNRVSRSRTAMAKEIIELRSLVTQMAARMDRMDAAAGIETAMFPDVPENHWAYEYVEDLQKRGALEGYPDGLFKGDRSMTRYEFAAMLDRLVRKGITLDSKIAKEFEPELGRIYVERISGQDNDRKKIERVRINDKDKATRDLYGSKIVPQVPGKAAAK